MISSNQTPEEGDASGIFSQSRKKNAKIRKGRDKKEPRKRATAADRRTEKTAAFYQHVTEPAGHEETIFRHSGWQPKRQRVRAALVRTSLNVFALDRFDQCGSAAHVEWSEQEQRHRVTANYCKNRHCEPCMRARATKVRLNLSEKLQDGDERKHRLITLTLKHSEQSLPDQLKRLYKSFSKLRGKAVWKRSQTGGAFMCEVKLGEDGRWHPHLHIVSEGGWLDQRKLSAAWHEVTGDSWVVDIRLLSRTKDAIGYVSKYITKGCSDNVWQDEDKATEWVIASRSLRICSTFGTWRGIKLTAVNNTADDWKPVCSLRSLYQRARQGEEHARRLIELLHGPTAVEVDRQRPPPPPNEGECPL